MTYICPDCKCDEGTTHSVNCIFVKIFEDMFKELNGVSFSKDVRGDLLFGRGTKWKMPDMEEVDRRGREVCQLKNA